VRVCLVILVFSFVLICSSVTVAAGEADRLDNDSVQVILFWTGASMRGHVVDSLDNGTLVFERADGERFEFKTKDIFSITGESEFDSAYQRLCNSERPSQGPRIGVSLGFALLHDDDDDQLTPQPAIGLRFNNGIFLGLAVSQENCNRYKTTPFWLECSYAPSGQKNSPLLLAQTGFTLNIKLTGETGDYSGWLVGFAAGYRSLVASNVYLDLIAGVRYIRIDLGQHYSIRAPEDFTQFLLSLRLSL